MLSFILSTSFGIIGFKVSQFIPIKDRHYFCYFVGVFQAIIFLFLINYLTNMHCKEIYKENSMRGQWKKQGEEGIEHQFDIIYCDAVTEEVRCSHCGAKRYPEDV